MGTTLKFTDKRNGKSFTLTPKFPIPKPQAPSRIPIGGYNPAQVGKKAKPKAKKTKKR